MEEEEADIYKKNEQTKVERTRRKVEIDTMPK